MKKAKSNTQIKNLFDKRDYCGLEGFVVQAVLALKTLGVGVVSAEQVVAVNGSVVSSEQTVGVLAVKIGYPLELLPFHSVEVLDYLPGNLEILLSVLAAVLEGIGGTRFHHLGHGGHVEGGVHAYLPEPEHLLGIHGSHGRTHNYIGFVLLAVLTEVGQCIDRINRYIGGAHL